MEIQKSGYSKGSIVRIKLLNFLTYSKTEFFPGPNMNMVIGPNGTGKSTVVCAIALGVGGNPEVLGRAKDLVDFIKHGETVARIEIELQNSPKNSIIRRSFDRETGLSKWKLDGKSSTLTDVKKLVSSLNIQVDNLCQFLPQDKVSGFAQMDPAKLLRETERAAGKDLLETHNLLAEKQQELKTLALKLGNAERELQALREKNDRLEPQVARLQERENIDRQIEIVAIKKIIAEYSEDVVKYTDGKALVAAAAARLEKANAELGPLKTKLTKVTAKQEEVKTHESSSRNDLHRCNLDLKRISEDAEAKDTECEDLFQKIQDMKKTEALRKRKIQKKAEEVSKRTADFKDATEKAIELGLMKEGDHDPSLDSKPLRDLTKERSALQKKIEDAQVEKNVMEGQAKIWATELAAKSRAIKEKEDNLKDFDNVRVQRLNYVRQTTSNQRDYKDTSAVIEWLRANRQIFKRRVTDPVILGVDLIDPKYAGMIETAIPFREKMSFVCEDPEDYYLMRSKVLEEQKLRCSLTNPQKDYDTLMRDKPSQSELRGYGFTGVLIDLVKADPVVMHFLAEKQNFHKIPYSLEEMTKERITAAERVYPRFFSGVQKGRGQFFITKSAYGSYSTRTVEIQEPQFLGSTVDTSLKAESENQLRSLRNEHSVLMGRKDELESSRNELNGRLAGYSNGLNEIKARKNGLQNYITDFRKKKVDLDTARIQLNSAKQEPSSEERMEEIHLDTLRANRERIQLAINMQDSMKKFVKIFQEGCIVVLKRLELESEVSEMKRSLDDTGDELRAAEALVEKERQLLKVVKAKARESHEKYIASKNECSNDPDKTAIFEEGLDEDESFESLDEKFCDLEARAAMIARVDPEILSEYNCRKKEIEKMTESVERDRAKVDEKTAAQKTMHDEWKAELESIVSTISASFSDSFASINCVGEVQLREDEENYANWGIEILVKFRSSEKLQVLTAQRQSGGERSVSTMLYLISLQSLSRSPFRVVDEINQGMDPRNERLVHKLIVKAACERSTLQYFLITPKLLPDLEYHEKMRVLCIFNGVWQPDDWDLSKKRSEREDDIVTDRPKRQKIIEVQ